MKLYLYCLEWLLTVFPILGHYTDTEIVAVSGRHIDKPQELSLWVRAVNMGLSFCFFFCENFFFFFFQRVNETEKLLCVLEVHSLQSEKRGIWPEPLKLPWQRNGLHVGTKFFTLGIFFTSRWKACIICFAIWHGWGIESLFEKSTAFPPNAVRYQCIYQQWLVRWFRRHPDIFNLIIIYLLLWLSSGYWFSTYSFLWK